VGVTENSEKEKAWEEGLPVRTVAPEVSGPLADIETSFEIVKAGKISDRDGIGCVVV